MDKKLCPEYNFLCEAYDGENCCIISGMPRKMRKNIKKIIKE